jgi:cysteine desulfurase / selenocysteine lyase
MTTNRESGAAPGVILPGTAQPVADEGIPGGEAMGSAGFPDPSVMARWANEFFAALPGDAPAAPSAPPALSEKDFRAVPQALAGAAGKTPQAPGGRTVPEGIPGSLFYFLEPAAASPGPAYPGSPGSLGAADRPSQSEAASPAPRDGSGVTAAPWSGFSPVVVPDLDLPVHQFDAATVKRDFPILSEVVNGRSLVWLDNAATTQKPQSVIDRLSFFYEHENSNVHRGAHTLAARSSDAYEDAREKVRGFLNAPSAKNIVFARGATEAINLVSQSWGRRHVRKDDEIVISWLEHHSNIVPWQLLCAETGARLRVAPIDNDGQVLLDEYEKLLGPRTRIVSFTHVSNALGTITPVAEMVAMAHRYGAKVLVDGAQAVSHLRVDVQALDCDFYVFSGHKVFGPTGIGALYGKTDALESMPPWQGGGNMIADVTFERTVYHAPPMRFEAGTGNIADAVGLGEAIDYLERLGLENVARHEHDLLAYGTQELRRIPGLRLIGTAREKAGVMSFVIDGMPVESIGQALAAEGIAVRAGHHCAQPAVRRFGLEGTVRPSLALYNTYEDIDLLVDALRRLTSGRGDLKAARRS